jgi:hypothetical protein
MPLLKDLVHTNRHECRQGHPTGTLPKNPLLRLLTGKLPMNEFKNLILATGIKLDANGYLTKESRIIASQVVIPHEAINTVEDEKEILAKLQTSNAMFSYAELQSCNCRRCRRIWKEMAKGQDDITLARPNRVLAKTPV